VGTSEFPDHLITPGLPVIKSFGLTWNATIETGGILVGDEVTITLDVEFVKA